jgi:hypothetical protein
MYFFSIRVSECDFAYPDSRQKKQEDELAEIPLRFVRKEYSRTFNGFFYCRESVNPSTFKSNHANYTYEVEDPSGQGNAG